MQDKLNKIITFLLLFALNINYLYPNNNQITYDIEAFSIESNKNQNLSVAQDYFNKGYENFKQQKYSDAIQLLDLAIDNDENNGIISYYSKILRKLSRNYLIENKSKTIDDFIKDIELAEMLLLKQKASNSNNLSIDYINTLPIKSLEPLETVSLEQNKNLSEEEKLSKYDSLKQDIKKISSDSKLSQKQKSDLEISYLNEAILLFNKAEDYLIRGKLNFKLSNYNEAIFDFSRYLELNPSSTTIYYDRALAYIETKQYDLAIKDLEKIIEYEPNNAKAYYQKGVIEYKSNNITQALLDLSMAGELGELNAYEKIVEINKKSFK